MYPLLSNRANALVLEDGARMLFILLITVVLLRGIYLLSLNINKKQRLVCKLTYSESLDTKPYPRNRKKPKWVVDKVIYLKAMMPNNGCGSIAATFNRLYADKGESVSKTYVYEKLKINSYQLKSKYRELKARKPKATAINQTWGMDLTTVNLHGKQQLILGIIDHGSRALLCLEKLESKHALTILKALVATIKQYGFPKRIRTDNEACFSAKTIKLSLALLAIKKQTTDIACPWQNGRIERCFGTFKQKWQHGMLNHCDDLQTTLNIYQTWYNVIRTHSHLDDKTPAEVFTNKAAKGDAIFVTGWDGCLSGYYFPD